MNTQNKGESINSQITLMMKSGEASIGIKVVMKKLRTSQLKGVLFSSNLPIL
jgi:ribosomal protein L30E